MFRLLNTRLRRLCRRLGWSIRRRSKPKVVIKKFGKTDSKSQLGGTRPELTTNGSAAVHPNTGSEKSIRIATFNAALFSMAPAVPKSENKSASLDFDNEETVMTRQSTDNNNNNNLNFRAKSANDRPKSILKQSPLHPNSSMSSNGNSKDNSNLTRQQKFAKSKLRVSINLPDNEISLLRNRKLSFREGEEENENGVSSNSSTNGAIARIFKGKTPLRHSYSYNYSTASSKSNSIGNGSGYRSTRTVLEVLKELDADILALQDVKAEEERDMKPLSDLAKGLGMNYVFAESWAPEYGNAVLSKWPIKSWKVQKIFDDADFRNVLKAVVDVPETGEVNFQCTLLDHLDESWRMKQINAIIHSSDAPHILAGGLNALDETDYSSERWTDIVKYYEEMGKPTPKAEVMRFLKSKQYTDAKDFAGECESVVMIAKGQSVQGTCKYGTRVDYILSSPQSPYKFVPGSYLVMSSKGTSDHHIVKVDVVKCSSINLQDNDNLNRKKRQRKQKVVRITNTSHSRGIWTTHS